MSKLCLAFLATLPFISAAALQPRQADPSDSITYCSSTYNPFHATQEYIPCTRNASLHSEIVEWLPYYSNTTTQARFSAHFECYAENPDGTGEDRYIAGHALSGAEPCWVGETVLGPVPDSCPDPAAAGANVRTCCRKTQLANCCALRAAGIDLNGYLNETYLHCP